MSKVIEVHRKVKNNIGDYYCNPSRYFNLGNVSSEELLYNSSDLKNNTLVIGGGGLIHKKFSQHIQTLIAKNPQKIILWAIGHNFGSKYISKSVGSPYYPHWINNCNLVGIRDYIEDYHQYYLPCVSCMHNAFDKTYEEKYDYVYFTHAFKSKYTGTDYPHLKNSEMDFNKVIKFIASGNTVITDSYHGAYWAQLLGKNVHVASWSVKFNNMKYPPHFLNDINAVPIKKENKVNGFLEECRTLNKGFYQKFLEL